MSYIRGTPRRWTEGSTQRVYPSSSDGTIKRQGYGGYAVPAEDWVEITMRMLERGDMDDEDLERVFDVLVEEAYVDEDLVIDRD